MIRFRTFTNGPEIEENCDEYEDENEALVEDDVVDEFDVDEDLPHEEHNNGNWAETDFKDSGDIPPFVHEYGANVAEVQENRYTSCLNLFVMLV